MESNSNVHNTRRAGVIRVTFQTLSVCQRSIHFDAAKLFNQLLVEITKVLKIGIFKRKTKELILNIKLIAHRQQFFAFVPVDVKLNYAILCTSFHILLPKKLI